MRVGEMHDDGRGLVEHERRRATRGVVDEHRDQPVGIEREVLGGLVRNLRAVDELQRERRADLLEHEVDDETGIAGEVMKLQHAPSILVERRFDSHPEEPDMTNTVAPRSAVIPALRYRDAPAAIEWLCRVIGFEKHLVVPGPDNTIAHAQLALGGGMLMLGSV